MYKPIKPEEAPMFVEYYKGVKLSTYRGGWIINENKAYKWSQLKDLKIYIDKLGNTKK
jgi:hypothetical protein